jgi:hypothetical protein
MTLRKTTPPASRVEREKRIVSLVVLFVLVAAPLIILALNAYDLMFDSDEFVHDVVVTESGVIYYTLETRQGGDSTGEMTLWRLRSEDGEPELVSKVPEDSCEGPYRDYSDWQLTGAHAVAVTVMCWGGRSDRDHDMWEYGSELSRVHEIDTEPVALGERDSLYLAGPQLFYREQRLGSACAEIYIDTITDGEVSSTQISQTLLAAAGIDSADTECPGSIERPRTTVDLDGDLWLHVNPHEDEVICEFVRESGVATCHHLDRDSCGFSVSQDGTRFACGAAGEDDSRTVSVFDAASAELVAELEIPSEGDWAFYDRDTIIHMGDDEALTRMTIP